MSMKISVIMGIYNCQNTLGEAIQCILQQTYSDWELIMCDDGSSDDTYNVALAFVYKYPNRIKLLRNTKNMGLNYALNRCLEFASGEIIARMDGDDRCSENRFEYWRKTPTSQLSVQVWRVLMKLVYGEK